MKNAILSLDYEIFGNGTGDIFQNLIEPMEELFAIAENRGFKYSIFFEAIEFLRIKREYASGNHQGYHSDPVKAVEEQIVKLHRAGHDIQLHIHPQWAEAKWRDGAWELQNNWSLGQYGSDEELYELVKEGKDYLESLLRSVDPEYKCIAIRAGGYCLQPSHRVSNVMKKLGLFVDSSIVPGAISIDPRGRFDYSNVTQEIDYWHSSSELENPSDGDFIELPLSVHPIRRFRKILSLSALKARLGKNRSSMESLNAKSGGRGKSSLIEKIRYVFGTESQTWDFCILLPAIHDIFFRMAKSSQRNLFVLVGHPKGFTDANGFLYFLRKSKGVFQFITLNDFTKQCLTHSKS